MGFGRILIRGTFAAANDDLIRRRIANVAARAQSTQTERRIASIERRATSRDPTTRRSGAPDRTS
jgi:hypothetical protein